MVWVGGRRGRTVQELELRVGGELGIRCIKIKSGLMG